MGGLDSRSAETNRCGGRKEVAQSVAQHGDVPGLALPYDQHSPACRLQRCFLPGIPLHIGVELRRPELVSGRGNGCLPTAGMPMPEAAVDEDDRPIAGEHQVGRAGQIPTMEAEAITQSVRRPADDQFRLGIAIPYPGHEGGASGGRRLIGGKHRPMPISSTGDRFKFGRSIVLNRGYDLLQGIDRLPLGQILAICGFGP